MIEKYTTSELDALIAEATKGQTAQEWMDKMMAGFKGILKSNRSRYRAFGPYWWPLKNEYIKAGDTAFGEFIDLDWLEKMDYGDKKYNIAAAFAYEETAFNMGLMDYPYHTLEDDGNPVEFILIDPDMDF